ncbi:MAG: sulfate permease [Pseudomonadales bacterium]|nr:sulfate permease [Pseudomonadales bacterium]
MSRRLILGRVGGIIDSCAMGSRVLSSFRKILRSILPIFDWGRDYSFASARGDFLAGLIVLFITVPQVIAYAFLAGLPASAGLYAAVLSLIGYALFGSSRTLAVGPAAIIAIMTLEAGTKFAVPHTPEYEIFAVKFALLTGGILVLLRLINFGAIISFLSHAVVTGFITAAAVLIMMSQVPPIFGLASPANTSIEGIVLQLMHDADRANGVVMALSGSAIGILVFCKYALPRILSALGLSEQWRTSLVRSAPMYVVVLGIVAVAWLHLDTRSMVPVVGNVPRSLPSISIPTLDLAELTAMMPSALLTCMVIFLESTSMGAAVASKRREKIEPNQELLALGVANLGAGMVGGFPVAGSFARTLVNYSAGAVTQVSSLVTAVLLIGTLVTFAPVFYFLPKAVLSAIIVLSAAQLIDLATIRKIFAFSVVDAITFTFTFCAVVATGVETGILVGIIVSFVLLIRASSKPHIAVVGRWGETEHFRNVLRHDVKTSPEVLAVRIDESLYFVNTQYIETFLLNHLAEAPAVKHVLLICTATNFIDSAGLEMLELLSDNLAEAGVTLHLSEVKGPVMDKLKETDFYEHMHGKVFFTTDIAMRELAGL